MTAPGVFSEIAFAQPELAAWRRDLHAYPELAFEERRTSEFVAAKLEAFGLEVVRNIGGTGIIGTLRAGSSGRAVALRADMDALPLTEKNDFAHRSKHDGRMHACGHDGHTVMLLAAARHLAQTRRFNGAVYFIFQPAEEANAAGSGAKAMIEDGLFDRFPADCVFGLHNWPELPTGVVAARGGSVMASMDLFDVKLSGRGGHGAFPERCVDPIVACAQLLGAWQTIVSRNIGAQETSVISATNLIAGEGSYNVIPEEAHIRGSARALDPKVRELIKKRFLEVTKNVAAAMGVSASIDWDPRCPPVINDPQMAAQVRGAAAEIVGAENVLGADKAPVTMGSEDFAYFLQHRPGAYLFLGNGGGVGDCMLHDPRYDFNDEIAPIGASLWVRLVERLLSEY